MTICNPITLSVHSVIGDLMSRAIVLDNCFDVEFMNIGLIGFDVGIEATNSQQIRMQSVDFQQCRVGLKGRNLTDLKANNCTHSQSGQVAANVPRLPAGQGLMQYAIQYLQYTGYNPYGGD